MAEINLHMLRDRADRLDDITEEQWKLVNKENRDMVKEYFEVNTQLSPKTRISYESCMRQFFWFVYNSLNDKPYHKITKRDFMKYMSYNQERGLSSSGIAIRKACVSSLCNYIENVVMDDVEELRGFRNFTKGMPPINKNQVYEKIAISEDEYKLMIKTLEEKEHWLGLAWVAMAFNVGARRTELTQFKKEILDYPIIEGQNYVLSHVIRGKGKGRDGKPLRYMINFDALKYLKLWIEKRNHDSEYIFTVKYDGKIKHISEGWANDFCMNVLSPICGRRINPHLFKASCITFLLEKGVDLKIVSKYIAQHNDTSTTSNHYDLRDFEEEKNNIF